MLVRSTDQNNVMPAAEQQAYLELVQELLDCLQGQELELLATKPELVNQQLVETLLLVAETRERDGGDNAPWLRGFAWDLAEHLGLELGDAEETEQSDGADCGQADLDFLHALIEAEQNDGIQVQQLFAQNLHRLTPQLGGIMNWFMAQILERQPENAEYHAGLIENIVIELYKFPLGNRAQNLEIVIAGCAAVLTARTKENNPEKWADTRYNLANAYSDRIRGDKAENLEGTIACYQSVLEIYTKAGFPIDWANTQNNLATSYNYRIRGEKAENLEQSIVCYQLALEIYTKAGFPIDWANTQNNLANTYAERIRGDREENLEQSIACYQLALEVFTKSDFPNNWAMIQDNFALTYSKLSRGDREENLERSIACYQSALEVFTKLDFPINWAITENNLAIAYWERIRGDKAENLERSIACYQSALEVFTKVDFTMDWAMTQNNLTNAYWLRIKGEKSENLERSIACCQLALEIYTKSDFPINWAGAQNNLANIYAERIRDDRAENLEMSIACYQSALEIRTPQDFPIECLQTARNLGNLHFYEENWQEAIDPYILAIAAVEQSRSWATSEQSKQEIIEQAISVYFNLVQCCINTQQYAQALEYAERSKSRNLVELLATRDLYPKGDIPAAILSQLDTLRRQVLAEERRLSQRRDTGGSNDPGATGSRSLASFNPPDLDINRERLASLRQDLDMLMREQVQSIDPSFQLTQQVQSIDFATMQSALPNAQTAAIFWYITNDTIHTFLVTPHQSQPLVIAATAAEYADLENLRDTYRDGGSIDLDNCLTLGEIFQLDLHQCRLVTLSACETGLTDFRSLGDEYVGLSSGFLYAGSANVVSSLWAVSDLSTTFLMIKFYQNLSETNSVSIALNQAQQWLRRVTKQELLDWIELLTLGFAQQLLVESWKDTLGSIDNNTRIFQSPYHWAAFCAIG